MTNSVNMQLIVQPQKRSGWDSTHLLLAAERFRRSSRRSPPPSEAWLQGTEGGSDQAVGESPSLVTDSSLKKSDGSTAKRASGSWVPRLWQTSASVLGMDLRHLNRHREPAQDQIHGKEQGTLDASTRTYTHTTHPPRENLVLHESCEETCIFSEGNDPQHISHLWNRDRVTLDAIVRYFN